MSDTQRLLANNPFPGLRAFEPSEADRFFGRREQIAALAARLAGASLLAVSGASGCGKSSLVRAGLLNELARRQRDEAAPAWLPAVMKPGSRPIANLAWALAAALALHTPLPLSTDGLDPDDDALALRAASLVGQLRLGGLGLVEVVRRARLPTGARVLVVVDQFEEVFRFRRTHDGWGDADEANAFVKLLLQAAADPDACISVVLTLRSDTLGGCADFPGLAEAVSAGSVLVPRLSRQQRKQAIVQPIALRGQQIAPRLVQRLLNDVSDDFDDLPVMQHALSRTWRHWAQTTGGGRVIDLEDYLAIGGADDALARHAEEALASLGPLAEPGGAVERVFRALTERLAEGTELRRPLPLRQLCEVCAGDRDSTAVLQVVERFRRADTAFLLPGAEVALDSNPVIDISHESLIRQWPQLRQWVATESEAAAELKRLLDDAHAQAEADGELWRGRNLERARDWQRRTRPNADWVQLCSGGSAADGAARLQAVQAFLDQSSTAEQQERRRAARTRWGLRALVAVVVLGAVGAAINGLSLQRAARAGELAARAILELAQDPARSAQLALLALDQNPANHRAEYALRQAMATLEVARASQIVALDEPITEARYTPDQQRLVLAGGATVWLLDAKTLLTQTRLKAPGQQVHKAWALGQALVLVSTDVGVFVLSHQGQVLADLSCKVADARAGATAYSAANASPGKPAQLAVGCSNGELTRWTLADNGSASAQALAPAGLDLAAITALGFSADGQWLASGDADGKALVWLRDRAGGPWIGTLKPGGSPIQHGAAIRDISFSRTEPSLLASASDDRSARVWTLDLLGRQLVVARDAEIRLKHERSVKLARFVDARANADDVGPLMTVSDKRVNIWSDENTKDERLHDDWVTEATVSDDGEYLVSASLDGTARVWSSRSTVPVAVLRGHRNEVTHALFGPAGQIVTTSRDRTVRLWQLQAPRLLVAGKPWQYSAAFDGQGGRAVLCGEKDSTRINCRVLPMKPPLPAAGGTDRKQGDGEALAEIKRAETVQGVSISSDGTLVLAQRITDDLQKAQQPVLWRLADRSEIKVAWLAGLRQAVFNPGRPELLTVGAQGDLAVWPQSALGLVDPGQPLLHLPPQGQAQPQTGSAALSPDGRWIAMLRGAAALLWDRQAPTAPPRLLVGHSGDLRALAFSPDGSALVTASADRTARVWLLKGLAPGAAPRSVELKGGHSAALTSASFSPDGAWVVTASADNSVRVWDAAQGLERAALYRHAGAVNQALFDASGELILSVSDDGTAVLGRCDACRLPLPALRQQASDSVKLAPGELAALGN